MTTIDPDFPDGRAFSPPTVQDLARCEDEPIHVPGAVQPHGCLFQLDDALRVLRVSSNLRALLGLSASQVLAMPVAAALGAEAAAWLARTLPTLPAAQHATLALTSPRPGTLVAHRYLGNAIVEFLDDAEHRFPAPDSMDRRLDEALAAARQESDVPQLLQRIAEGVKDASGIDRVMVYRFHPDWHGEVVAEKTEPGLTPFRGLHYPASDIPAQARALYLATRVRVIVDVYARDAVLMDAAALRRAPPLDLSQAFSRSVSPVHIQYLRNMGSGATLVSSLVVGGKLWGLIACHHRTRYPVPWYAFERMLRFTDAASGVIADRLATLAAERQHNEAAVVSRLQAAFEQSAEAGIEQMMQLIECPAAVACVGERVLLFGAAPASAAGLPALLLAQTADIGSSDHLVGQLPDAAADAGCAGLAWSILSRTTPAVLAFLRPEFERTVNWGGNPEKAMVPDPVTRRLNPRGSFDTWRETVSGRSRPWAPETEDRLAFLHAHPDLLRGLGGAEAGR